MPPTQKAYTLIELLITLTIITITASITIPNFQSLLTQAESKITLNKLQRSIAYARSEAMLRGVKVTLCGSDTNHNQCTTTWQNGILIFTDESSTATITSQNQILRLITINKKINWRSSFKVNYLQIQPQGTTNGENGTFWYCARKDKIPDWALVISLAGRARVVIDESELKKLPC